RSDEIVEAVAAIEATITTPVGYRRRVSHLDSQHDGLSYPTSQGDISRPSAARNSSRAVLSHVIYFKNVVNLGAYGIAHIRAWWVNIYDLHDVALRFVTSRLPPFLRVKADGTQIY